MKLAAVVVAVLCSTVYAATPTATIDSSAKSNSTSPRFTDNSNGTVKDNVTGLIWLKNTNCFGLRAWLSALNDVRLLASGGCGLTDGSVAGDWRLPTQAEWRTLIDFSQAKPVLHAQQLFVDLKPRLYWARPIQASKRFLAWKVTLDGEAASITNENETAHVWPVRGGQ